MIRRVPYIPLRTPYSTSSVIITIPIWVQKSVFLIICMNEYIHIEYFNYRISDSFFGRTISDCSTRPRVRSPEGKWTIVYHMHYFACQWDRTALFEQDQKTVAPKFPFAFLELETLLKLDLLFNNTWWSWFCQKFLERELQPSHFKKRYVGRYRIKSFAAIFQVPLPSITSCQAFNWVVLVRMWLFSGFESDCVNEEVVLYDYEIQANC